jgi:GNAT superfamily N-acetyltransferase
MLIKDVRDLDVRQAAIHPMDGVTIRHEVRPGDGEAIIGLHAELYPVEYGMDERFVEGVRGTVEAALAAGWPEGGGAWLVERHGLFSGSVGLTDEGDGLGRIRWVLLHPRVRGLGLGRRLVGEAVERARELGMSKLELDTFSDLCTAAKIYRGLGFRVRSEERTTKWGPEITYQYYELDLTTPER